MTMFSNNCSIYFALIHEIAMWFSPRKLPRPFPRVAFWPNRSGVELACNRVVGGNTTLFTGKTVWYYHPVTSMVVVPTCFSYPVSQYFLSFPRAVLSPTSFCSVAHWELILKADALTLNCNARLVKSTAPCMITESKESAEQNQIWNWGILKPRLGDSFIWMSGLNPRKNQGRLVNKEWTWYRFQV